MYGLASAEFIDRLWYDDEATTLICYGGNLGAGKSAYNIHTTAEVYGSHAGHPDNIPDYEEVKSHLLFTPKDMVQRIVDNIDKREKTVIMDDLGLWFFALDWRDSFVVAFIKYLNVARTNFAVIQGNTPSPMMLVGRLRNFPNGITVKVSKLASNIDHPNRPRLARAYRRWVTPDLKKSGVRKIWEDRYVAMMPDSFFRWYKPKRDRFARMAINMMRTELEAKKKQGKSKAKENLIEQGFFPDDDSIKEMGEVVDNRTAELKKVLKDLNIT